MLKAFKYRLYPNKEQQIFLSKSMGCARYIYNKALETKIEHYKLTKKSLSYCNLANNLLLNEKANHEWLKEPYSQVLQMSLKNLDKAFQNFFHKKAKFPKFKKKSNKNSISYPQHVKVDFKSSKIYIPKCGQIFTVFHRKFFGKIKTCTVSKTSTNKYWISILVDDSQPIPKKVKFTDAIGIDLGIKTFATLSNGIKIANPKFLDKSLNRLAKLQERFSAKQKDSNNRQKARLKLAKCYEKITNQRHDFLHKKSFEIIRDNQAIILEDLSVQDMIERGYRNISRNISDAAWRTFVGYLEYKAERQGKTVYKINRFDASSKTCSKCGWKKEDLTLADREWTCGSCHFHHDRDENAAKNIRKLGMTRLGRPEGPMEAKQLRCFA